MFWNLHTDTMNSGHNLDQQRIQAKTRKLAQDKYMLIVVLNLNSRHNDKVKFDIPNPE